jgi:ATP-dependent Clp protease ATP-binding subunit ClpA
VIELAVKEAKRLNHGYIGTEHLLLGMLREGHGIACGVLQSIGLDFDQVRAETLRVLGDHVPVENRLKRYNLVVPEELFDELQQLADRDHTTVVDLLRRFIKLGLLATRINETPGSALLIREGEKEREILLL